MDIQYNIATDNDINGVLDILNRYNGDRKKFAIDQFICAKINQKIIGCVRIKELSSDTLELASLAVKPDYRNKGIGSKLIKKVLTKEKGRPIYLLCSSEKENFYKQNNFHLIKPSDLPEIMKKEYDHILILPFSSNIKVIAMVCIV